ncbi:hypothetical protein ACSIGC_01935 [Tenacibaculum sp. ZS6-P6]|uniref:hypothetical protein n=1 Tax=Tenacibaculum sp. ZS6-P6 TaxID=3447503 RepID=UPI003F9D3F08
MIYATKFNNELTPWSTNDYINFGDYFLRNNDYLPPLTVKEYKHVFSLKLVFTGSCKWRFRVYWEDNLLVICGEKEKNKTSLNQIRPIQAFKRIIIVPKNIKLNNKIDYEFTSCQLKFKLLKKHRN